MTLLSIFCAIRHLQFCGPAGQELCRYDTISFMTAKTGLAAALCCFCVTLAAQTSDDPVAVFTEHPRLFLRPQRLRLLKRERERDSMRWRQFDLLVRATAQMREPGFALALHYAVTGDAAIGRRAVEWALGPGADLGLATSVVLDAAPGRQELVAVFCQDPLPVARIRAMIAADRTAVPVGCSADRFHVVKPGRR